MKRLVMAVAASLLAAPVVPASEPLALVPIGSVKTGLVRTEDPRIAEINAFDAIGRRIYVVNPLAGRLDVIDAGDPSAPTSAPSVDIVLECQLALGPQCPLQLGSEPNSVAIRRRLMAVAVASAVRTDNGHAVFFELRRERAPRFVAAVEVGALPDMVTFSEDGEYVLTANEGEPDPTYTIDPVGSVSIIEVDRIGRRRAVRTAGFERFDTDGQRKKLERDGVRIFGPGASVSQDLEPEYIAVRGDKAFVTLQENNALAIVDIDAAEVEKVVGLGLKDHARAGNALDASDQDGGIQIQSWPVRGLYQPDAIQTLPLNGKAFLIMANEGDAREYAAFTESVRLGNAAYVLDPIVFPNAAMLKVNAALGRLNVSTATGDADGDGDFDRIDVPGARSISIRDPRGDLVWDSGEMFERLSASLDGGLTLFNTTNTANTRDNRSDDKGVEPESVVVGEVRGRLYAFVGLERDSGLVVLDVSDPSSPDFVTYATNRKLPRDPTTQALLACNDTNDCGDLGPEGLTFVSARQSPTGRPLLLVSNEVSSTTTIWEIR